MENLLEASSFALRGGSPPQKMLWRSHPSHLPPGLSGGLDAIHRLNCNPGRALVPIAKRSRLDFDQFHGRHPDRQCHAVSCTWQPNTKACWELSSQCLFSDILLKVAEWRWFWLSDVQWQCVACCWKKYMMVSSKVSQCDLRNSLNLCRCIDYALHHLHPGPRPRHLLTAFELDSRYATKNRPGNSKAELTKLRIDIFSI